MSGTKKYKKGDKLRLLLEILSITQSEFASKVGCDRSYITRAINNPEMVSDLMKVKIARAITQMLRDFYIDSRGIFN